MKLLVVFALLVLAMAFGGGYIIGGNDGNESPLKRDRRDHGVIFSEIRTADFHTVCLDGIAYWGRIQYGIFPRVDPKTKSYMACEGDGVISK